MKKIIFSFLLCLISYPLFAEDFTQNPDFKTADEILALAHPEQSTECATAAFADALYENRDKISPYDDEDKVRAWANVHMFSAPTLKRVLNCPEIKSITDRKQTIVFTPIVFKFDTGREIIINYSTQPKVLDQKLLLTGKRSLPNGDPNPKLMDDNDPAIYINTDPSWYAIMVVQHGSLSHFVGPDKNNTVSIKYINDNIDSLYPHGYYCTSKSAIANDNDTINQVVHEVVDLEDDSNDYYVAGDINLEWIMYAEIAADIAITVATLGVGTAGTAAVKMSRATKISQSLIKNVKNLRKIDKVQDYINVSRKISKYTDEATGLRKNIKNSKKYEKALENLERARKNGGDVAKYEKQANDILNDAKKIDSSMTPEKLKNAESMKDKRKVLQEQIKNEKETAEKMVQEDKNVKAYKENSEQMAKMLKYRRELRATKRPQTGNIISRTFKGVKATYTGAKDMKKAARVARRGISGFSNKASFWLKDQTLKHGARIPKFIGLTGGVYGVVAFLGDMYDKTSTTSQEYSNGIEFKPLCLLSADDLKGYENVVNYGMWLMWTGNSEDDMDDDAAFLQAVDFATKFYYTLQDYQDENGANCNVDIYVVHPIIRLDESDENKTAGEMFYLVMNDEPWTTAGQFNEQISNIQDWEQKQLELEITDPNEKYKKPEQIEQDEPDQENPNE